MDWNDPAFRDAMAMAQRDKIARDQRKLLQNQTPQEKYKIQGVIFREKYFEQFAQKFGVKSKLAVILNCKFCETESLVSEKCLWCGETDSWKLNSDGELFCSRCDKKLVSTGCKKCGRKNPAINHILLMAPSIQAAIARQKLEADARQEEFESEGRILRAKIWIFLLSIFLLPCLYGLLLGKSSPPKFWGAVGVIVFGSLIYRATRTILTSGGAATRSDLQAKGVRFRK